MSSDVRLLISAMMCPQLPLPQPSGGKRGKAAPKHLVGSVCQFISNHSFYRLGFVCSFLSPKLDFPFMLPS